MKEYTTWDRILDFMWRDHLRKIEYYFAKRWLDRNFGEQEYWGEYLMERLNDVNPNVLKNGFIGKFEVTSELPRIDDGMETRVLETKEDYLGVVNQMKEIQENIDRRVDEIKNNKRSHLQPPMKMANEDKENE